MTVSGKKGSKLKLVLRRGNARNKRGRVPWHTPQQEKGKYGKANGRN